MGVRLQAVGKETELAQLEPVRIEMQQRTLSKWLAELAALVCQGHRSSTAVQTAGDHAARQNSGIAPHDCERETLDSDFTCHEDPQHESAEAQMLEFAGDSSDEGQ